MSADSTNSADFPAVLQITPNQIKIDVELNVDKYVDLKLLNLTDSHVAFKIKTTARDRYLLRPTQDILKPREEKSCKIVMSAMKSYPDHTNPKNVKDKFLVQSLTLSTAELNSKTENFDLTKMWKQKELDHNPKENIFAYHEERIKCKLNVPAAKRAEQAAERGAEEIAEAAESNKSIINNNNKIGLSNNNTNNVSNNLKSLRDADSNENSSRLNLSSSPGAPINSAAAANSLSPGAPINFTMQSANQQSSNSSSTHSSSVPSSSSSSAAAAAAPHPSSSSASTDLGSDFERSTADKKRRDYNELMDFVVKLTAQMEREKVESAQIADKYQKSLQTIAQLQKKNSQLLALQQTSSGSVGSENSNEEKESELARVKELKLRNKEAITAAHEATKAEQKLQANSSIGYSIVIIVALIAFIAGKLLA